MNRSTVAAMLVFLSAMPVVAGCNGMNPQTPPSDSMPAAAQEPSASGADRPEPAPAPQSQSQPPRQAPPMSKPLPPLRADCDAKLAESGALGRRATPEVVEQARRDAGARTARVLRPGQVVTMEYLAGRLNVRVDDDNTIVAVTCG